MDVCISSPLSVMSRVSTTTSCADAGKRINFNFCMLYMSFCYYNTHSQIHNTIDYNSGIAVKSSQKPSFDHLNKIQEQQNKSKDHSVVF